VIYILFFLGFVLLIKGADFLVDGAVAIANKFNVSPIIIGLTIVAFGTSLPELIVNIFASFEGNTDLAIGNVVGSNIANILLILGVAAMIYPLAVQKQTTYNEIPFSLLAAVVLGILANDKLLDSDAGGMTDILSRSNGLLLLCFFTIFMYYVVSLSKKGSSEVREEVNVTMNTGKAVIFIILGMVGLTLGGDWIVDGAVHMATQFGISQALVGLTIVAIGTSLPELATSAVAAYKKNTDIAIGNVVGSNIFNIFWILGISSVIKPLPFNAALNQDILVSIFTSLLLFIFLFIGKKHLLERWQGAMFLLMYVAYISYLVYRG
jgi:cation:H+ antiporter